MFVDLNKLNDKDNIIMIDQGDKLEAQLITRLGYSTLDIFLCPLRLFDQMPRPGSFHLSVDHKENNMWWFLIPTENMIKEDDYLGLIWGIDEEEKREEVCRFYITIRNS